MKKDSIDRMAEKYYGCTIRWCMDAVWVITEAEKQYKLDGRPYQIEKWTGAQWHTIFQEITEKSLKNYWTESGDQKSNLLPIITQEREF
jgi:hypothetical protein